MRGKIMIICLVLMLCTGCSALPAEERSYAVAVGISCPAGVWEVSARIPSYQTGGGYATISAQGATLPEAFAVLDTAAPMRMHYGQVRLLIVKRELAESAELAAAMEVVSRMADMRLQAQVCVTQDYLPELMDALSPMTGTRLSKSIDILLETRKKMGVIPEASLSQLMRMGERRSPVLAAIALAPDDQGEASGLNTAAGGQKAGEAGNIQLGGAWLVSLHGAVRGELTAGEMQLLALLQNRLHQTSMKIGDGIVNVSGAKGQVQLDGNTVKCSVEVQYTSATLTGEGIVKGIEEDYRSLTRKLAATDCDALGLGAQAVRHFADMAAWHSLNWPEIYPQLQWEMEVRVIPAA